MLEQHITRFYKNQSRLSLLGIVESDSSIKLCFYLSQLITAAVGGVKAPSKSLKEAVAALVSGLLHSASIRPWAFLYRAMGNATFTDEHFGYRVFKDAYDTLTMHGFIKSHPGKKGDAGGIGTATRMRATPRLIDLAAGFGIELHSLKRHFGIRPPSPFLSEPVIMRAPSTGYKEQRETGKKLKLDHSIPAIRLSIERVNRINVFLSTSDVAGVQYWMMQRIFCDAGDAAKYGLYGGRLYAPYQNVKRNDRANILINGEPTCEIDISGSFLTIYHSLAGKPLDTSIDPYAGVSFPRPIIKACINAAFGNGRLHTTWPPSVIDQLENSDDPAVEPFANVVVNYPIAWVCKAVEARFPALAAMGEGPITWGDLHYAESEVVLATMEELAFKHGITSLPMHDAIIVPVSKAMDAADVLSMVFERQIGVKPKLTFKRLPADHRLAA